MSKKRIAFVISSLSPGGAERVVSNLANTLIADFQVTIIVLYNDTPFYKLHEDIDIVHCEEVYELKKSRLKSLSLHFKFINNIKNFIKQLDIDLCISFMTTTNIYATLAARATATPIVVCERTNPHFGLNKAWQLLRKWVYPLSDLLLVQTQNVCSYYEAFMPSEKIDVVKNPLSPELLQKRAFTSEKENVVLCVGRLSPEKNHDLIIKAFAEIMPNNWKLVIVGDGFCRPEYESLISELQMTEYIQLVGNSTEVDKYYSSSKIFVFTSRFEGFPNALLEAMAFGMPCISTNCDSGPSDLITNGENGFLIPVEDQAKLVLQLKQLIDNESLRTRFGKQAQITAKSYEIENVGKSWSDIINRLV